jgi:pimeloyl-ACP methyl ester carboxylesterase
MALELHTLLTNANIKAPYILAGHSLGGVVAERSGHNVMFDQPEIIVESILEMLKQTSLN